MPIINRVKSAWNAFVSVAAPMDPAEYSVGPPVYNYGTSPSRPRFFLRNDRTVVTAIYNRISIDAASVVFRHIQTDDVGRYAADVKSNLNLCLNLEANIDQAPRAFRQDIVMSLFDRGSAAIVPVDTTVNPETNDVIDIYTLRVGDIVAWYPKHIRVNVYNEATGQRQDITLEKKFVAIVENPLYSIMNSPNSTLQRLIHKLSLLDAVDEQSSSGKLDLIIQLPYVIKSEARRLQAEQRREQIEMQLKGSQYGIAYTDGTEKITQLNRPAENNLLAQIEYLTTMLYGQLGITEEVMNGTADEKTMLNYYNRTIDPIVQSIIEAMQRAFISRSKVSTEQIQYFKDPFKLVPASNLAQIADKFTRNEILTSNEIRGFLGIPPSKDPRADQLVNSNIKGAPIGAPGEPPSGAGTTVAV